MFDSVDLRQVMRRWASGVAVVITGDATRRNGLTVSSLVSVSVNPPAVSVTLQNSSSTRNLIEELGYFSVNLLSAGQESLSERFAGKIAEHEDRFEEIDLVTGVSHAPLLASAAAVLECRVIHRFLMTDSTLYVGEVIRSAKRVDQPPLVYFNRGYHRISDE